MQLSCLPCGICICHVLLFGPKLETGFEELARSNTWIICSCGALEHYYSKEQTERSANSIVAVGANVVRRGEGEAREQQQDAQGPSLVQNKLQQHAPLHGRAA